MFLKVATIQNFHLSFRYHFNMLLILKKFVDEDLLKNSFHFSQLNFDFNFLVAQSILNFVDDPYFFLLKFASYLKVFLLMHIFFLNFALNLFRQLFVVRFLKNSL